MVNYPLVSIALCTYNGGPYLQEQLQTLIEQSYSNIEIVIVDDNSTDGTIPLLQQLVSADARLKLHLNEHNLGYVKNFEKAIKLCAGNYIALADQDDIWEANKIELMVNNIGDAALIYHDSALIDHTGKTMGRISNIMNMYQGNSPLPFLFYNCISGHSCMFSKKLVNELGGFDPNFHHDWWLAYVAANKGGIKYIDKPLVKYRQHQYASTDILNMKAKPQKGDAKYAELNILWLKNCLRIEGRYNSLIETIIILYESKTAQNSFRLVNLLLKYFKELYFIKKKGIFNKLNYVRKMVFFNNRGFYTIGRKT